MTFLISLASFQFVFAVINAVSVFVFVRIV